MRRAALGLLLLSLASCGGDPSTTPPVKRASVFSTFTSASPKTAPPAAPSKATPREDASVLARSVLFANPDRTGTHISPDGKRISYLSNVDGVLNVWVAPIDDLAKAKPVTSDKKRGVRGCLWAYTNEHIIYPQDEGGDENWHVHAVDLKTGIDKDLTPYAGAQARIEGTSWKIPNEVVVACRTRRSRSRTSSIRTRARLRPPREPHVVQCGRRGLPRAVPRRRVRAVRQGPEGLDHHGAGRRRGRPGASGRVAAIELRVRVGHSTSS